MNIKSFERALRFTWMHSRILLRWGTLWPKRVKLKQAAIAISIDPRDNRARKMLIKDAIQGNLPRNRKFWNQACMSLKPDAALDVGVNFGECLFMPVYDAGTRVFGFEANPVLHSYLQDSMSRHPHRGQMSLHCGLVGGAHGGEENFHIDTQWSGSSAMHARSDDAARYRMIRVPTISVDGVLAQAQVKPRHLLYKIDVEGYESHVLEGMKQPLDAALWSLGFMEFNESATAAAGIDIRQFYERLQSQFHVYGFNQQDRLIDLANKPFSTLDAIARKKLPGGKKAGIFTDFVLVKGQDSDQVSQLLHDWM